MKYVYYYCLAFITAKININEDELVLALFLRCFSDICFPDILKQFITWN